MLDASLSLGRGFGPSRGHLNGGRHLSAKPCERGVQVCHGLEHVHWIDIDHVLNIIFFCDRKRIGRPANRFAKMGSLNRL